MRHRKSGVKLNRTTSHRQAMFRNMVTSLLKHDKIKTTEPKAKELRKWADHIITLAKRGDLHARRQAMSIVREKDVVHKLFEEASERFGARKGGYTRIIKIGHRPGDAAPLTIIELVTEEDSPKAAPKKSAPKPEEKPAASTPTAEKEDDSAEKSVGAVDDPSDAKTEDAGHEVKAKTENEAKEESTDTPAEDADKTEKTKDKED